MGTSPIEWALVEMFHQPPNRAKMIAAAYQVVALVLLIAALAFFVEWRFVQFAQHGCAAFCNCTLKSALPAGYVMP